MRTLFLFIVSPAEEPKEDVFFFELEGNYRHLDGVYVNLSDHPELEDELCDLVYDEDGNYVVERLDTPTTTWDVFVKTGFYL